jgi:hypothetical protein
LQPTSPNDNEVLAGDDCLLLKEKIFLANCDSVRRLSGDELYKRFLLGVTFAQGVIVTPSLLLDNFHFVEVLSRRNVGKWFTGEGSQTISIRTPGTSATASMTEYFDALPPSYVLNRFRGKTKAQLSRIERFDLRDELASLDRLLALYQPETGCRALKPSALSDSILIDNTFERWLLSDSPNSKGVEALANTAAQLHSRSAWYSAVDKLLGNDAERFRTEVVDPAYHGLFVSKGEAFALDRIAVLDRIPAPLLNASVSMRAMRQDYEYVEYALKAFNLVSAFGTNELLKYFTDEAVAYLEEKAQEQGYNWASRRDWFGLYSKLTKAIGVEVK